MKQVLTRNAIWRTSHKYIEENQRLLGSEKLHGSGFNPNNKCPLCKSEFTSPVTNAEDRRAFDEYYNGRVQKYTALNCDTCHNPFSYWLAKEEP